MESAPEPLKRRRLIPLWAIVAPAALLVAGLGLIGLFVYRQQTSLVSVPNVMNLEVTVARSRLAEERLLLARGDRRFSPSVPIDDVIDQSPAPGAKVPPGTQVVVIVSAGSESFPMPDVTGLPLQTARESLQAKGLVVQTEVVASSRAKNTVVSSDPVAGVTVSSSGTVKLSVSSGNALSAELQPANLTGKVFVLDPAPSSIGATDTTMEVQRRLFSLLEASGAKVLVTRVVTDATGTLTPELRAQRAIATSATAVVGLDVGDSKTGGFAISSLKSFKTSSSAYLGSSQLSRELLKQLDQIRSPGRANEVSTDPVLSANDVPAVRVVLGSTKDKKDAAGFADPVWEDKVASAIYEALANVYGSR